jgi:hypothetical protein
VRFAEYLRQQKVEPAFSFAEHLRRTGGAIEE